jgi:EpsI family protein
MASAVLGRIRGNVPRAAWPRLALLAGVLALYAPTFASLAGGAWGEDEHAHGPLILAVSAALAWRERARLRELAPGGDAPWGAGLVLLGVLLWLLGRTQGLVPIEAGSLIPVAAGAVMLAWGAAGLRVLAFALAFLVFYVPLPGFVLELATAPLKEMVSTAVAWLLGAFGYAVERSGVVLAVEGREMLVADACSGLNSIVSLFALALLYAHLRRASRARTLLLVAAIVPIAVAANILRVLALVLITVHFGPQAAEGFVHEALGLSVFVVALLMLIGLDRVARNTPRNDSPDSPDSLFTSDSLRRQDVRNESGGVRRVIPWMVVAGMLMAAALAPALRPAPDPSAAFDLEAAVPAAFGGWRIDPTIAPVTVAPDVQANLDRLYRQVVARTYVNEAGERMMLTVAHGGDQSDALKAHRQEVCYRAQGFRIQGVDRGALVAGGRSIDVTRFLALRGERSEPVTYWFTMGDRVVLGRLERLRVQLAHGLRGRVPDGLLVRVSSLDANPARAHAAQAAFVDALAGAVPRQHLARLVGAAARS